MLCDDGSVLALIASLKTSELVKDILRGWHLVRHTYPEHIRTFSFSDQTKDELRQLAYLLYEKHTPAGSSPPPVRWDDSVFQRFFSVLVCGRESFSFFAYPHNVLVAESLDSNLFDRLLRNWSASFVSLEDFVYAYWHEKWLVQARFSPVDLQLLQAFFTRPASRSSIGFPTVRDFWHQRLGCSESSARSRYQRFLQLGILVRHSVINYAKLGLCPLLKIYDPSDRPSDAEVRFSSWELPLPSGQTLRLLAMPVRSSFWTGHSAHDVHVLHSRCGGVNIDQFDGSDWTLPIPPQSFDHLSDPINLSSSHWQMDFTAVDPFPFTSSDLRLLMSVVSSAERQTTHLAPRSNLTSQGYTSGRLHHLREAQVFQTYFKLYHVGLSDRFYVLAQGSTPQLMSLYRFACLFPRYYIIQTESCLLALLWFTPALRPLFVRTCATFQQGGLSSLVYGRITTQARTHIPHLPALWNEDKMLWYSEPE